MAEYDRAFELFSEMQELSTPLIFATTMLLIEEICKRRGYCPAEFLKECFEIKKEAEDFRMKEVKNITLKVGLALQRIALKLDDSTLEKIKPDLEEIEAEVIKLTVKLSDLLEGSAE